MPPAVHQVQKFTFNDLPEPARPPPNKNIPTSVPREPRLFHRTHAHISRRRTWPRAARPALVETHAASRALNFVNCRTVHEQSPEPPPRPGAVAPGAAVAGPRSADGGGGGTNVSPTRRGRGALRGGALPSRRPRVTRACARGRARSRSALRSPTVNGLVVVSLREVKAIRPLLDLHPPAWADPESARRRRSAPRHEKPRALLLAGR